MRGITKLLSLAALTSALMLTGCATRTQHAEVYQNPNANFLGIIKVEPGSFEQAYSSPIQVSSDELIPTNNFSGDRVTLLWGLITIKDY